MDLYALEMTHYERIEEENKNHTYSLERIFNSPKAFGEF